jgi:Arc/MetJ-type ribon-helix-helix transcriptional regulator
MKIHLPKDVEGDILAAVQSGHFASMDDAMTKAASMLLEQLKQQTQAAKTPTAGEDAPAAAHRPIWEIADEIRKSIPEEEWAKLPADGASQLDHYLYGSPKRPTP